MWQISLQIDRTSSEYRFNKFKVSKSKLPEEGDKKLHKIHDCIVLWECNLKNQNKRKFETQYMFFPNICGHVSWHL